DRNQRPGRQRQDRELARGDQQMPRTVLHMERAQLLTGQRVAELGSQRARVLTVMMRFHRTYNQLYYYEPYDPHPNHRPGRRAAGAYLGPRKGRSHRVSRREYNPREPPG